MGVEHAERTEKERIINNMYGAFDSDGSEFIDMQEFVEMLKMPHMQSYFKELNLDTTYAAHLFRVLDSSDDGKVELSEFVEAMGRLTRPAMALETSLILQKVFFMGVQLDELVMKKSMETDELKALGQSNMLTGVGR